MSILPKWSTDKGSPYQNSNSHFYRHIKTDLKIHLKLQGVLSSQNNLKKNRMGLALPDFKI